MLHGCHTCMHIKAKTIHRLNASVTELMVASLMHTHHQTCGKQDRLTAYLQAGMRWLESAYPDKARGWVGFNVPMSHKITAACDLLLMPSRFEPCGLNQLYAMRYGTVPVAHATGGLRDTVLPFNPWEGRKRIFSTQHF